LLDVAARNAAETVGTFRNPILDAMFCLRTRWSYLQKGNKRCAVAGRLEYG
jgi:hypothetical protein